MRYYLLERDPAIQWGATASPRLPDEASFLRGALVVGAVPEPLVVRVNHPASEPPRAYVPGPVPVVHRTLASRLREAGADNFEVFPARLENPDAGCAWDEYLAINVVGLVTAVDLGASVYATLIGPGGPPPLVAFDRVTLRASGAMGLRMFRVPESPPLWFVDEGVVRALRAARPRDGWGLAVREVAVTP